MHKEMRKFATYHIDNVFCFKENLLCYANDLRRSCVLISNVPITIGMEGSKNEMIVAVDCIDEIIPKENSFEALQNFHEQKKRLVVWVSFL